MKPTKLHQRRRRQARVRSKIYGTSERPRLAVYRSLKSVYAQLIDDSKGEVLVASSSLKESKSNGIEAARKAGKDLAKKAKTKKIESCVFDRAGFLYHGRVKALAEGAREGGLQF